MKKTMKIILVAVIFLILFTGLVLAGVVFVNSHVKNQAEKYFYEIEDIPQKSEYDCILVLGCGVYSDGTPSPMLEDRLKKAIELYKAGTASKILMSGDHGQKNYDEVNIMREYALEHGVPEEDIFMDHAGFSTYESMYRAKEVFCAERIIVVTQKYHLYRGVYIANRLGLDAIGTASDYRLYAGQTGRDVREVAARVKDFFGCMLKPKPTYLGEVIPVSGNGTVTCD